MERIDNTGFGNIKAVQQAGLGYGLDSILLAAFAAGETGAKAIAVGSRIADLGSGNGIIGFIICHKIPETTVVGIEKRTGAIDRARRAAVLNQMEDRISFINADVKEPGITDRFDAVVSNPPYFRRNAAIPNATDDKHIARHETTANIDDWMKTTAQLLNRGGDCYIVHRPDRLPDVFQAMRSAGIEPKSLQLVSPGFGDAANIALIHGIKGAGAELKMLPEITVHTSDGAYTDIINRIYERIN